LSRRLNWCLIENISHVIIDLFNQAQLLSPQERRELAQRLIESAEADNSPQKAQTGAEIVAMLEAIESIEFVDPDIEDPVEWVKAQRRKRQDQLNLP
jgi:hypothetical protein